MRTIEEQKILLEELLLQSRQRKDAGKIVLGDKKQWMLKGSHK